MGRKGTEKVDLSGGEGEASMTERGQTVTEEGQNRGGGVSSAAEDIFIHLHQIGRSSERFVSPFPSTDAENRWEEACEKVNSAVNKLGLKESKQGFDDVE